MHQPEFALKILTWFNLFNFLIMRYLFCFATFQDDFTFQINFSTISLFLFLPINREVYYWICPSFLHKQYGKSSRAAIFERYRRSRRCRAWVIFSFFASRRNQETREAMFSSNVQHITNICILKSLVAQREHADILYCLYFAVFERDNETLPFRMHIIGLRVYASWLSFWCFCYSKLCWRKCC